MNYKILGKTKLKTSGIGFGGIMITTISESQAIDLIKESYDRGINLFDTASGYLNSEILLGRALKKIRDKVIISTKSMHTEKRELLNEFNNSLKNLRTDYIDIFLFHETSKSEKFDELISNGLVNTLLKEKQKGKVRFIGFSCHNPQVIERFYEIDQFMVLMIPINFIYTEFTVNKTYKKLIDKDIGILGMKPLCGGGIYNAELSFKYIRQFKEVIPVVGMKNLLELKQNLKYTSSKDALNLRDLKEIKKLKKELGTRFCRFCGYCMPCSQGINIREINCLERYHRSLPINKFLTLGRTNKVQKVDDCVECGKCEEKCPYSLPIINMLKKNRDFYFEKLNQNKKVKKE